MQRVCSQMCTLVYKHTCVTYTPAHALVSRTPFPKCMQHSLQKNAHIHILTPICIRIHMHTNTHAHASHRPHAEVLILRPTIYVQTCIHIHIHMCINAYIYIYIHTCTYIYIYLYTCPHTYTHTHIYTHAYKMYIWTHAKHVWNDSAAGTAREAQFDAKKLCPSSCPLQSGGWYPSWPAVQLPVHEGRRISAEQPQPIAAHHTIKTARHPDHIRLSAVVRSQFDPVHDPPKQAASLVVVPQNEVIFLSIWWVFSKRTSGGEGSGR